MDIGEKFTALENMIYNYACTQFDLNQIPPSQARIIMKCVYSRVQERCIDNDVMTHVSIQQVDNGPQTTEKSGTIEDFMKDYEKAGFTPDTGEPKPGEENKDDNTYL